MADNVFTKGYADSTALTETQLDTAYKSLKLDISNTTTLTSGSTAGQFLKSNGSAVAASFASVPDPLGPFALRNYGLSTSVSAGALTVALKTKALSDPSASDAIDLTYSTNGTTSATYNSVQITAATSLAITASATLGFTSTSANKVFVYGYYNTATTSVKLAVSGRSDLDSGDPVTTVAMSATADSGTKLYATAALSVVPRLLGYVQSAMNSSKQWQTVSKVNLLNDRFDAVLKGRLDNSISTSATAVRGQVAISASSGTFSHLTTASTAVTNLSVTLPTGGRPVYVGLISDTNVNGSNVQLQTSASGAVEFRRGTSTISVSNLFGSTLLPPSSINFIDMPGAGTFTYTVRVYLFSAGAGKEIDITRCKLIAYEI